MIIVRFVKVNDYLTSSDRLVIFDVRTGNILYNELNSFSTFAEAYDAYNVTNNFIINMKEVNKDNDVFENFIILRTKPEGGFWASRVDADYG